MKPYQVAYGSTGTRLFTDKDRLREKTFGFFEIDLNRNDVQASLYRASSSQPGTLSRDCYRWTGSGWERIGEDSVKFATAPARTGGHRTQIGTFEVWSEEPLTEVTKERLREMLRLIPATSE